MTTELNFLSTKDVCKLLGCSEYNALALLSFFAVPRTKRQSGYVYRREVIEEVVQMGRQARERFREMND
jgi:hypothetical protein